MSIFSFFSVLSYLFYLSLPKLQGRCGKEKGVETNGINSAGWFGTGDVQTYCHTGGGSAEICTQVQPTTIVINPMTGIGK